MFSAATPQEQATGELRPVLVVDDDGLVRALLCDILREEGFSAIEASNALEAATVLRSSTILSAMITDVSMPGRMNGIQLAAYARQNRPDLKIVIISGEAPQAGAELASDAFIPKPVELRPLIARLKQLTGSPAPTGEVRRTFRAPRS
jgi:CheY-like chemotaxis protein